MFNFRLGSVVAVVVILSAGARSESYAAEITVQLASGRTFTAELGPQSGRENLVLVFRSGGAEIQRPVKWDKVVSITAEGKPLSIPEVREAAAARSSQSPSPAKGPIVIGPLPKPAEGVSGKSTPERATSRVPIGQSIFEYLDEPPPPTPPLRSLALDVTLGRWTAGVESSGLIVKIMPLDDNGEFRRASGTLEIQCFAPQRRDFNAAPRANGISIERIASWTTAVHAAEFGRDGFVFRAPLGAIHPEFRSDFYAKALVTARLSVPGEGVFDASQDGVRLRPYAPTRELLERSTGGRFLSSEATLRGKSWPGAFSVP